jgi:hypothetical protein
VKKNIPYQVGAVESSCVCYCHVPYFAAGVLDDPGEEELRVLVVQDMWQVSTGTWPFITSSMNNFISTFRNVMGTYLPTCITKFSLTKQFEADWLEHSLTGFN